MKITNKTDEMVEFAGDPDEFGGRLKAWPVDRVIYGVRYYCIEGADWDLLAARIDADAEKLRSEIWQREQETAAANKRVDELDTLWQGAVFGADEVVAVGDVNIEEARGIIDSLLAEYPELAEYQKRHTSDLPEPGLPICGLESNRFPGLVCGLPKGHDPSIGHEFTSPSRICLPDDGDLARRTREDRIDKGAEDKDGRVKGVDR